MLLVLIISSPLLEEDYTSPLCWHQSWPCEFFWSGKAFTAIAWFCCGSSPSFIEQHRGDACHSFTLDPRTAMVYLLLSSEWFVKPWNLGVVCSWNLKWCKLTDISTPIKLIWHLLSCLPIFENSLYLQDLLLAFKLLSPARNSSWRGKEEVFRPSFLDFM